MRRVVASWILAAVCVASAWAVEPANRKSNPQVKAVLDYFYSLSGKTNHRIVSGQFTNFGNGSNLKIMERIHESTGQWPALMGADYADFRQGSITTKVPNTAAIEYWKQGGLVSIMAHMYNPANPKGGGLRDKGVDIADLLKKGTDTNKRWMQQLDLIAEGLLELKAAGVVVLWRPFHEMNGDWFWWGAQKPESFIAVWRHMFDYFSTAKGLDNLIWVYGPNHGEKTAAYYAGDDYVDLLGLDAYTDSLDPEHVRGYDEIVALNKPFGFSEYGPHGSRNPPGDYDYRRFIEGVKKHFPKTCYFMCWNAQWSLATNQDDKGHKSSGKHWSEDSFSYSKEFHTYGLLREPDKIVWYIDGVERSRFTEARVIVSEPMYLLINFGIDARWPGPCDATTPFPSYYECDEIKVYQRN